VSKSRTGLYIICIIAMLNSCETNETIVHAECEYTWFDNIAIAIKPEWADEILPLECYDIEAMRI
jgi:hypothetical protein